jgi:hypothetical protein
MVLPRMRDDCESFQRYETAVRGMTGQACMKANCHSTTYVSGETMAEGGENCVTDRLQYSNSGTS